MDEQVIGSGEKGQLVTFRLGRETYGIEIFKIQEVLHFREVTVIPNAPQFVEGVIELRDRVIPIVDLKKRLGVGENGEAKRRIVILDFDERPLGIIVDDISQVLLLEASQYEALPEPVVGDRTSNCIARLAKADDELIIVISPERILTRHEREILKDFEENNHREQMDAAASSAGAA